MKTTLLLCAFLGACATGQRTPSSEPVKLRLSPNVYFTGALNFLPHKGDGRFDSTLAMNVPYTPITDLRAQLESSLGRKLDFFKGWDSWGEAHITVITPVEYYDILKSKLSMQEIETIASRLMIQRAEFKVLALGSGKNGDKETFFVIVDSEKLRAIRMAVWKEYVSRGGRASDWDPTWFFPHITVGYVGSDLHESDGVIKSMQRSRDLRFNLVVE